MSIGTAWRNRGVRAAVGVLLAVGVFVAGARWGLRRGVTPPPEAAVVAVQPGVAPQIYTCSMHPQIRTPDPNEKCPICAMALIPVPADGDEEDDGETPRLRLSARAVALMDIQTWPAERRAVKIEVALFGKVGLDERRVYDIVARAEAYVERLAVNAPWQPVESGDVLAEFFSPAASTAMRELLVTTGRGEGGGLRIEGAGVRESWIAATRARLERIGVSARQIAEIERSGEVPRTFRVESPIAGVAMEIGVRQGEWLAEGARLIRVADLSRVWINLEAYERDVPWLGEGISASFEVAALPGRAFEGVVTFVEPVVNPDTRTVRVRLEAENPDGALKPGQFVTARVHAHYRAADAVEGGGLEVEGGGTMETTHGAHSMADRVSPSSNPPQPPTLHPQPPTPNPQPSSTLHPPPSFPLVIPATAPLIMGRRALVYVRVPGEDRPTFEPRPVVLGPRAGDVYIVESGLREGDLVVVNGQFKIDSELQIRGRPSMMAAEGGGAPAQHHGQGGPEAGGAGVEGGGLKVEGGRLQTECPVMGGAINTDFYVDVEGYRLFVCCPGCDQTILENPAKYIEKMKSEGVTPYRLQTHCPIMNLPIDRELFHDHEGHRIYVCCPGCLDEVRQRAAEIVREQWEKGVVFEKRVEG